MSLVGGEITPIFKKYFNSKEELKGKWKELQNKKPALLIVMSPQLDTMYDAILEVDASLRVEDSISYKSATAEVVQNDDHIWVIEQNSVRIIQSMYPSQTGQKITIKKNRVNSVVFEASTNDCNNDKLIEGEINKKSTVQSRCYTMAAPMTLL